MVTFDRMVTFVVHVVRCMQLATDSSDSAHVEVKVIVMVSGTASGYKWADVPPYGIAYCILRHIDVCASVPASGCASLDRTCSAYPQEPPVQRLLSRLQGNHMPFMGV